MHMRQRKASERPTDDEVFEHQIWTLAHLLKLRGNLIEVKVVIRAPDGTEMEVMGEIEEIEDNTAELHQSIGLTVRVNAREENDASGHQPVEAAFCDERPSRQDREGDPVTGLDPRD